MEVDSEMPLELSITVHIFFPQLRIGPGLTQVTSLHMGNGWVAWTYVQLSISFPKGHVSGQTVSQPEARWLPHVMNIC